MKFRGPEALKDRLRHLDAAGRKRKLIAEKADLEITHTRGEILSDKMKADLRLESRTLPIEITKPDLAKFQTWLHPGHVPAEVAALSSD
jgi:hypothetical protein